MEWESGRRLKKATASGKSVSYTYDTTGLRTSKTYNGTKYSYAYAGDKLIWQGWGNEELYFFYNASGEPLEFWHYTNGTKTKTGYYYTNLQGDVVRIEDYSGNVLASYSYDPWGKLLSSSGTYATKNPLRYRGYYYDTETGFYYLQSRYYDPTVSRFINADSYASTGQGFLGYNMFAYCLNDPVSYSDPSGHMMAPYFAWECAGGGALVSPNIMSALGGSAAGGTSTTLPGSSIEEGFGSGIGLVVAMAASALSSQTRVKVAEKNKSDDEIVIYRYGGTSAKNLTPREKDEFTGLSFSTIPKQGAAMTTIGALNATGEVYAKKDGITHVSVTPVNGTMAEWIKEGKESTWTKAVQSVVIKYGG